MSLSQFSSPMKEDGADKLAKKSAINHMMYVIRIVIDTPQDRPTDFDDSELYGAVLKLVEWTHSTHDQPYDNVWNFFAAHNVGLLLNPHELWKHLQRVYSCESF
eukprot:TRINITY_DN65012_c0_g2_i2.p2 TRINITY_DN65012_c0_g2~~TRINITY_DN65012_c0_g2_i2.p2  ORF type:complete len:104 (-),score=15.74 TRINITY_DN65012_c0_g2_i2:726-1037(-)